MQNKNLYRSKRIEKKMVFGWHNEARQFIWRAILYASGKSTLQHDLCKINQNLILIRTLAINLEFSLVFDIISK